MSNFKVGDLVEWTSQSAGVSQRKVGRVVQVVPPGGKPEPRIAGVGMSRDHQSYVVMAAVDGRDRNKRYWPRASALVLHLKQPKTEECPAHGDALKGGRCPTCDAMRFLGVDEDEPDLMNMGDW